MQSKGPRRLDELGRKVIRRQPRDDDGALRIERGQRNPGRTQPATAVTRCRSHDPDLAVDKPENGVDGRRHETKLLIASAQLSIYTHRPGDESCQAGFRLG